MIAYLDTSAFVPLLIAEPGSAACMRLWDDADTIASTRLLYVETWAALAQARRLRRISLSTLRSAGLLLDEVWPEMTVVEVDDLLVERAAALAHRFDLRGYDAVHCASAEQLSDVDVVAAAGDRRLLDAWRRLGLATFDSNS